MSQSGRLWGGRFSTAPDAEFARFSNSFGFDRRLLPYELAIDRAWADALVGAGVLTPEEAARLRTALDELEQAVRSDPGWLDRYGDVEDVHSFVEAALVERLGALGGKLRAGRSRNELVVTATRLFVRDAARQTGGAVAVLVQSLHRQAEHVFGLPMAGQTHLQPAQPILVSHFLLAHAEAFLRDLVRLRQACDAADACPLGSGALAGTGLPIDRWALARALGFSRMTANSLDAVGDRDFVLDYLFALTGIGLHLGRLASDAVLLATPEFGRLVLSERFSTGSSLMPQKKNPDAWELVRGSVGRVLGALVAVATVLKGLPSSYHRDLQEDKPPLFEAHDRVLAATRMAAAAVAEWQWNEDQLRQSAADPGLLATVAAEALVQRGVPFREAHELVGKLVREAERRGVPWTELVPEELQKLSPVLDADWKQQVQLDAAIGRCAVPGGTAAASVRTALEQLPSRLAALTFWEDS
jgi:argininosuccinate lyase